MCIKYIVRARDTQLYYELAQLCHLFNTIRCTKHCLFSLISQWKEQWLSVRHQSKQERLRHNPTCNYHNTNQQTHTRQTQEQRRNWGGNKQVHNFRKRQFTMTACNTLCLRTIRDAWELLSLACIDQTGDIKQLGNVGMCVCVCVCSATLES